MVADAVGVLDTAARVVVVVVVAAATPFPAAAAAAAAAVDDDAGMPLLRLLPEPLDLDTCMHDNKQAYQHQ